VCWHVIACMYHIARVHHLVTLISRSNSPYNCLLSTVFCMVSKTTFARIYHMIHPSINIYIYIYICIYIFQFAHLGCMVSTVRKPAVATATRHVTRSRVNAHAHLAGLVRNVIPSVRLEITDSTVRRLVYVCTVLSATT